MTYGEFITETVPLIKIQFVSFTVKKVSGCKKEFGKNAVPLRVVRFEKEPGKTAFPAFKNTSFYPGLIKIIVLGFITDKKAGIPKIFQLPVHICIEIGPL